MHVEAGGLFKNERIKFIGLLFCFSVLHIALKLIIIIIINRFV